MRSAFNWRICRNSWKASAVASVADEERGVGDELTAAVDCCAACSAPMDRRDGDMSPPAVVIVSVGDDFLC